jgi:HK97 gp10 family phage protein
MSILRLDIDHLNGILDDLAHKAELVARPAAQAAAQVLYDQVKRNVAAIPQQTGNLARSIYQVYSQQRSGPGVATYQISWNKRTAPHGYLVEFGHIQRYATYVGKDGKLYTAVRPSKRGTPRPGRRASQAAKDAYYVPLAAPKQVSAKPFLRSATSQAQAAADAAEEVLLRALHDDT